MMKVYGLKNVSLNSMFFPVRAVMKCILSVLIQYMFYIYLNVMAQIVFHIKTDNAHNNR